jgi:hypothetical protein
MDARHLLDALRAAEGISDVDKPVVSFLIGREPAVSLVPVRRRPTKQSDLLHPPPGQPLASRHLDCFGMLEAAGATQVAATAALVREAAM